MKLYIVYIHIVYYNQLNNVCIYIYIIQNRYNPIYCIAILCTHTNVSSIFVFTYNL